MEGAAAPLQPRTLRQGLRAYPRSAGCRAAPTWQGRSHNRLPFGTCLRASQETPSPTGDLGHQRYLLKDQDQEVCRKEPGKGFAARPASLSVVGGA